MAHPLDLPSLKTAEAQKWLPRWSRDDLRRIENVGQLAAVPDVPRGAPSQRCCVGRSECVADGLAGARDTFSPWKVETPELGLVRYDGSLVMVAAHQGNYGALLFRGCRLEDAPRGAHGPEPCP